MEILFLRILLLLKCFKIDWIKFLDRFYWLFTHAIAIDIFFILPGKKNLNDEETNFSSPLCIYICIIIML